MKSKIFDLIKSGESIVLLTHETPDGDAIGSVLAFYHMLTSINKSVDIVLPKLPNTFKNLLSIDRIVEKTEKNYDLAIVLDCASKARIGQINDTLVNCKKSIAIDHHMSNALYCDFNYVEGESAACCQVIYYLFKEWNIDFNKDIGTALATGLLTDTNGFAHKEVNKDSFLMTADLIDLGIDLHELYYNVLSKKTMAQYLLMKMTLDRIELCHDGKIAFSYISAEDMENVGAKPGDHEGLAELGRNIDGVLVSIFMREDDGYRISLRSNGNVNVTEIASKFGGGGHKSAAGLRLTTSFKETKDALINETIKVLDK